jgi:amino-acid N-acetyltransferase
MIIDQAQPHRNAIIALLSAEKLPTIDLPETLDNFIAAIEDAEVIGVAGLEIYGSFGLLRSVAVRSDFRSQGIAAKLLRRIDALASLKGITEIYLLTETASDYFERKTFRRIDRAEVPEELQQSSEFSHVCPQSAIVMKKIIF